MNPYRPGVKRWLQQATLVVRIQKRTGETREAVEKAVKESCSTCGCK